MSNLARQSGRISNLFVVFTFCWICVFASGAFASNKAVGQKIQDLFASRQIDTASPILNSRYDELNAFYKNRNYKPIWVRDNGPKGKAKALMTELYRSVVHGLHPEFYNAGYLSGLMSSTNSDELAELELQLDGALFEYANDLSNGHANNDIAPNQNATIPIRHSVFELLDGAEKAGELRTFLSSMLHVDDRYIRLIAKIAEMKRAEDAGLWPKFAQNIPPLKLGDSNPEISKLRTHLVLTGDFLVAKAKDGINFDRDVEQAVRSFQSRHGLTMNGELDKATIDVLTAPIEQRIDTISLNLERRRWQNKSMDKNHAYVNLADNSIRIVRNNKKLGSFALMPEPEQNRWQTTFGKIIKLQSNPSDKELTLTIKPENNNNEAAEMQLTLTDVSQPVADMFGDLLPDGSSNNTKILKKPMDVFVTYVTAWANKDGSIHFRPDLQKRDPIILKALSAEVSR